MCDKKVGKYQILMSKHLGSGKYADVYCCKKLQSNQEIAVKVISKKKLEKFNGKPERLYRQISIMKQLKSANIVQFIDFNETSNNFYIFQEMARGGSLRVLLRKEKVLEQDQAVEYFSQILQGFIELIKNGIVHRDIKPDNILIDENFLKIADFGFAYQSFNQSKMASRLGTPVYMSPQILKGSKYSYKTDIWSLGVLLYEMVTGTWPWYPKTGDFLRQILSEKLSFKNVLYLSPEVKNFIEGCLRIKEEQRFGWKQVFTHPLFAGKLKMKYDDISDVHTMKMVFIMAEVRESIYKDIENAKEIFNKAPEVITSDELFEIIKAISPQTSLSEVENISFDCKRIFPNESSKIIKNQLLQYFAKFNISFDNIRKEIFKKESLPISETGIRSPNSIQSMISKKLPQQLEQIKKLFLRYADVGINNIHLNFHSLAGLIFEIDSDVQWKEVSELFREFFKEKTLADSISFEEFYQRFMPNSP